MDIDFDFFDPKEIDFHGNKSLLKQAFSEDAETINLSELSDLIIAQKQVGSTVKVSEDGEDDPYALMTVINVQEHADTSSIQGFKKYLLERIAGSKQTEAAEKFKNLLESTNGKPLGWLVNEHLINVPAQLVPPMVKMLVEELGWAVDDVRD